MSKRRMTPLATALILVDSLSPEEIATLADYLRGKMPRPKSQSAPSVPKRSPRKHWGDEPKANTEGETVSATTAAVCAVPRYGKPCGLPETSLIHNPNSDPYHVFHATIKTKAASGD